MALSFRATWLSVREKVQAAVRARIGCGAHARLRRRRVCRRWKRRTATACTLKRGCCVKRIRTV
eukprot:1121016-Prymnesium_polylepis.1